MRISYMILGRVDNARNNSVNRSWLAFRGADTRRPEEIFAAEDETDWNEWVEFFSRTRETDGRRKGLVELEL